jgi:UDP-N-acetylglucosamine 2-epimerase (non-hydrolysing)
MRIVSFLLVAGARPNFMKIAPIIKAIDQYNLDAKSHKLRIHYLFVHTGQHYQRDMSECFFRDLALPKPDVYLGVGSGTHAEQTAKTMLAFEKVCLNNKTDLAMVVGDVNSTVACALVAAKLSIPVAHVEAGLRSFDRRMPEEINRILTDQISDYLFTTSPDANENLRREGIPSNRIFFVGNVMIDTLLAHIQFAQKSQVLEKLGLRQDDGDKKYAVVTLHRPSNVDDPRVFGDILRVLRNISEKIPIIFPAHPRTLKNLKKFGLEDMVDLRKNWKKSPGDSGTARIVAIPPLGYLDFLCLMSRAAVVLTDSGGIQEETTILGIPCLTIRDTTERPITIREGTNILTGNDPAKITKIADRIIRAGKKNKRIPRYWDGKAAERIINVLTTELC